MIQDGEHKEDVPTTLRRPSFLLNLKSFAARNPVFAPGAEPEDEASETEAESDSEISDQVDVTSVHDTTADDPADYEEPGEKETDKESPVQDAGLCLSAREWNIHVLMSEFRTKQLEAHHPAQVLINHPSELEFSQLADAKKALHQVKSLPTDQRSTDIKEAENSVRKAERNLEVANARLDTREIKLKLERSSQDIEKMKEYEERLRAGGEKRKADVFENSPKTIDGLRGQDKTSQAEPVVTLAQAERETLEAAKSLDMALLELNLIEAQLKVAKSQRIVQGSGGNKEVFAVEKRLTQAELHIHLLCMRRDKAHRIWQLTQLVEQDAANPDIIVNSAFVDHDMVDESAEAASESSEDEPEQGVGHHANQANTNFQVMTDIRGTRSLLHHQHTGVHPFNRKYADLQEMADQNATNRPAPAQTSTQPAPVATPPLSLHGLYDPFAIPLPRPLLGLDADEASDDEEVDFGPAVPYDPARARRVHAHSVWALSIHALRDAKASHSTGNIEILQRTMEKARNAYMALGGVVLDPVDGNPYIEPGEDEGVAVDGHVAKKQKMG